MECARFLRKGGQNAAWETGSDASDGGDCVTVPQVDMDAWMEYTEDAVSREPSPPSECEPGPAARGRAVRAWTQSDEDAALLSEELGVSMGEGYEDACPMAQRPDGMAEAEEEGEAEEGKQFVSVKPWLGAIKDAAPSGWSEKYSHLSTKKPRIKLELEHIYGYKTRDMRKNCKFVDVDTIVFFAGSIGVVQDTDTSSQYFYKGHTDDICSIAFNPKLQLVATGSIGTAKCAPICMWTIDQVMRTTKHVIEIRSDKMQHAVVNVAFSSDGSRLIGVGNDFNHTIGIFNSKNGNLLMSVGTPGRNPLFDVEFFTQDYCENFRSPGWTGKLDPDDYFVTAGWKHIYVWSFENGRTDTIQKYKGALSPYVKHGKKVSASDLGQESFTSVGFGVHHIIATSISSVVYLFKINPPAEDRAIKRMVMYHAVVVPLHTSGMRVKREAKIADQMVYVMDQLKHADTADLLDDLTKFGFALLSSFDGSRTSTQANKKLLQVLSSSSGKLINDAETALNEMLENGDAVLKQLSVDKRLLKALTIPFCTLVRKALSTMEELQSFVQSLWVTAIREGHKTTAEMRAINLDGVADSCPKEVRRKSMAPNPAKSPPLKPQPDQSADAPKDLMHPDTFLIQRVKFTQRYRRCELPSRELLHEVMLRIKPEKVHGNKKAFSVGIAGPNDGIVSSAVYDGRYLVTGGSDGFLSFFDLYPGAPTPWTVDMSKAVMEEDVKRCKTPLWEEDLNPQSAATLGSVDPPNCVRSVNVSPDRGLLAVGTMTGSIYVANLASTGLTNLYGEVEAHFGALPPTELQKSAQNRPEGYGEVWGLSPHPYRPWVVSCGDDSTLRVWDTVLRSQIACRFFPLQPFSCQVSPDGHLIGVGFRNGSFGIFSTNSLTRLWPPPFGSLADTRYRGFPVTCVRFSPNNSFLAVATGKFLDVYRVRKHPTPEAIKEGLMVSIKDLEYYGSCIGASGSLQQIDWSRDSTILQTASKSYEVMWFDLTLRRGKRIAQITHGPSVADVKWTTFTSPFGWSVQGIFPRYAGGSDINGVAISSCGNFVVTGDDHYRVNMFNYPCVGGMYNKHAKLTSRPEAWRHSGHAAHITNVCWMYNDKRVFSTGGSDCVVAQWKVVAAPKVDAAECGIGPKAGGASKFMTHPMRPKPAKAEEWGDNPPHPPGSPPPKKFEMPVEETEVREKDADPFAEYEQRQKKGTSPASAPQKCSMGFSFFGEKTRRKSSLYALGSELLEDNPTDGRRSFFAGTGQGARKMSMAESTHQRRMSMAHTATDRQRRKATEVFNTKGGGAEVQGGRRVDRPKTKKWLEETRGPIHRPNYLYRNRQMLNLQRRKAFEKKRAAMPDAFAQTAPAGGHSPAQGPRPARATKFSATHPAPKAKAAKATARPPWNDDNLTSQPLDSDEPVFGNPKQRSGIPSNPDAGKVPVQYEDFNARQPRHGPRAAAGPRAGAWGAHPMANQRAAPEPEPEPKPELATPTARKPPGSETEAEECETLPTAMVYKRTGFTESPRASIQSSHANCEQDQGVPKSDSERSLKSSSQTAENPVAPKSTLPKSTSELKSAFKSPTSHPITTRRATFASPRSVASSHEQNSTSESSSHSTTWGNDMPEDM
eukprot:TRINITY_DN2703_c0_g4_i1.p1 TRINITY_DN2703_c0_g4~~TRINITY_DN2703_c0_g4_i1.p1  ORF type:complete len:1612 (+),score=417.09 TRINITY_DN2703_c0_g4_i1:61-4896(+)